ncbi:TerC family protein [Brevibacillus porteri]|uniref:TerC family protein n=1 Tax=Brevibacillus porteri TaxID=2126350 RepID=A0ABX5FXG0_9BACL|nr:TerC family protein [Brevibacillus porteri]MED1801023.1 TerC family protein [Brevibacillus porteri]MED2130409.1 TerC family protein [Brevibacillus porteri]MED2745158.1 TerC family protein [Brevibacillus porteri]MED2812649.1 TerC family protein [Brevibacillus porteri]MED2895377.1 TerC family protein [Brevibacillus porteri]
MEMIVDFLVQSWSALLAIILIDIVLSGDNAVVIAMAARNLPKQQQKKAIFIGTFGAITLRIVFAAMVVWLIQIPLLKAIGGLLLLQVAYKLLAADEGEDNIKSGTTLMGAVGTIIYADALMSLDNVIAVAGVSHGSITLIAIGVLVSIPIILIGSAFILKALERFPIIAYIGSGILAWTAGDMIVKDKIIQNYISSTVGLIITIVLTVAVILAGWLKSRKSKEEKSEKAVA